MGLLRRRLMIKEALKRALNDSLVDAWVFSGYENADAPTSIVGVNGNKLACHNFAWNETGSGFMDGALWFDGVVDYLTCNTIQSLNDFTLIIRRTIYKMDNYSCVIFKSYNYNDFCEFAFESSYNNNASFKTVSFGKTNNIENIAFNDDKVLYMTPTNYNGTAIERGNSTYTTSKNLVVGNVTGNQVQMSLKYFALYDRTLTESEIQEEISKLEYRWNLRKKITV